MLNVLLVGCGNIAGGFDDDAAQQDFAKTHAKAYQKNPHAQVIACVDNNIERAGHFSLRWGGDSYYACIADIPTDIPIDIVSICSSTETHKILIEEAIKRSPKAIFCEKPLSLTCSEGHEILALMEERGISMVVNYSRRWDTKVIELQQNLSTGVLGEIRNISAVYNKGLLNNGSHMIDLLRLLFGELSVVRAWDMGFNSLHNDKDISAILKTPGGKDIHLICNDSGDYSQFELTILTSECEIRMLDGGLRWCRRSVQHSDVFPGYKTLSKEKFSAGGYFPVMENAVQEVVTQVLSQDFSIESAKQALATQETCEEIVRNSYEHS